MASENTEKDENVITYVEPEWLPVYDISCFYCNAISTITVVEPDEKPNYCPMCGEENVVSE